MASACSLNLTRENSISTPFCDRNFRTLRVLADFVYKVVLSLFFSLASYACLPFSHEWSQFYKFQSHYHMKQSDAMFTYFVYGNQIVDFALNSVTHANKVYVASEIEALKGMYGEEPVSSWLNIGTREVPLVREKLARRSAENGGCCFGMSLDFISRYLQCLQAGKTPRESVKTIAPLYEKGASDEAQLAQIFYEALDRSACYEESARVLDRELAAIREQFETERDHILNGADNVNPEELQRRINELFVPLDQRMQQLRRGIPLEHARIDFKRDKVVAEKMGLLSTLTSLFLTEQAENENFDSNFQNFIDQMPQGAYRVGLVPGQAIGHSIVYINGGDRCFIHEPNFATLEFDREDSAKMLWNIGKKFYLKQGPCNIRFTSITLS